MLPLTYGCLENRAESQAEAAAALRAGKIDIEHCYHAHYVRMSWALPLEQVTGNFQ